MLLVGLDAPGIVEHVEVVEEDALFDPLAAGVVPVREPIDHHVVLDRLPQIERLDGDALDLEAQGIALPGDAQVEALDHVLEAERPAEVGAQRQPDVTHRFGHGGLTHR